MTFYFVVICSISFYVCTPTLKEPTSGRREEGNGGLQAEMRERLLSPVAAQAVLPRAERGGLGFTV